MSNSLAIYPCFVDMHRLVPANNSFHSIPDWLTVSDDPLRYGYKTGNFRVIIIIQKSAQHKSGYPITAKLSLADAPYLLEWPFYELPTIYEWERRREVEQGWAEPHNWEMFWAATEFGFYLAAPFSLPPTRIVFAIRGGVDALFQSRALPSQRKELNSPPHTRNDESIFKQSSLR